MKTNKQGKWVETVNSMGYMAFSTDPFTEVFLEFCEDNPGSHVFEGGAAYGVATHRALEKGAKVTANDSAVEHLEILYQKTPLHLRSALKLAPGKLPYDLTFPSFTYDMIYSSRMIHFLTGGEVDLCMQNFFHWLKEGGKLFIIAETPYLGCYSPFIPAYEAKKKKGDLWPGLIDTSNFKSIRYNNIPDFLNFFDPDIMRRTAEKAGFVVEECTFINRKDFPPEIKHDGRESVGLIATKPSCGLPQ